MRKRFTARIAGRALAASLALSALAAVAAEAPWKPGKRVEIIVPSATGGGNDRLARLMQAIMHKEKLVDAVTTIVNKPGAGMALGMAYLNQYPEDAHYLLITSVGFLTNHITGRSEYSHRDVTPVALLFEEYVAFAVRPDSKLRTGKDLMAALRSDVASVSTAMASAGGNHNHIALAAVARRAGADPKGLKIVAFPSGGKALAAALGGHVDLVVAPAATLLSQAQQGLLRMIAITAPKRQAGALAEVPTWNEQGADAVVSNWRVILAPRGVPSPHTAYWENVFARLVETAEWKEMLEKDVVTGNFRRGGETRKFLDDEYRELQVMLDLLGLVKKK